MRPRMLRQGLLLVLTMVAALGASACAKEGMEAASAEPAPANAEAMAPETTAMADPGPATYRIELTPLWTKASFPLEYPDTSLLHRPHFSGLIGAAHDADYHVFAEGQTPTPGLERLAEMGKHDPLDAEIQAAIAAGDALALTESDPIRDLSQPAVAEVQVDGSHSLVSVVAMIAPSPDWFAGVADVDLMEGGAWVASKTVEVSPWDAGGDAGTTYLADDADTDPKQPTALNRSPQFVKAGAVAPVARITFTRM